MPLSRKTKFGENSGMRFNQFNKCAHSIKIIIFLLGDGNSPGTLQMCFIQISEQTSGFKDENVRLKECNLSTGASKGQSCDLNLQLTSKPTFPLTFLKYLDFSKPQSLLNMCVCSHYLIKVINSQNYRFLTFQNLSHDFNVFAIFSE